MIIEIGSFICGAADVKHLRQAGNYSVSPEADAENYFEHEPVILDFLFQLAELFQAQVHVDGIGRLQQQQFGVVERHQCRVVAVLQHVPIPLLAQRVGTHTAL